MLYDLNTVLAHSAKGTNWKKHKYIRKEGKKYIYKFPSSGSSQMKLYDYSPGNNWGSENNKHSYFNDTVRKIGDKYYPSEQSIGSTAQARNADRYNADVRQINGKYATLAANGGIPTSELNKAKNMELSNARQGYENQRRVINKNKSERKTSDFSTYASIAALKTSDAAKKAVKKGKNIVSKLFGK